MEFFKTVADVLQDGQQLTLTIRKSGQNLVASILSDTRGVKDKAVDNIVPLIINGTPEEFEDGFEAALQPLAQATGLVTNIKDFEESVETARKASDMAKKQKDEAAKQKKQFNDLIDLARKNKDEHKFKDAKTVLAKASALPGADKSLIQKVEKEIALASGEGNMFGGEEDLSDGKNVGAASEPAAMPTEEEPEIEDEDNEMSNENEEEE